MLIFDADDYVGNDISPYVNTHRAKMGWIMASVYKMEGDMVAPIYATYTVCGTGNIFWLLFANGGYIAKSIGKKFTERVI